MSVVNTFCINTFGIKFELSYIKNVENNIMTIQGKLFKKFEIQQVSDRFKKREFVIEYADNPEYPQFLLFQLTQDKVDLIEDMQEGQMVEVDMNLRGREWVNPQGVAKYFNSLEAWRLKALTEAVQAQPQTVEAPTVESLEVEESDLPF